VQAYWTSITSWHLILWVKYVKLYVPPTEHKLILNYSSCLLFYLGSFFSACLSRFIHTHHAFKTFIFGGVRVVFYIEGPICPYLKHILITTHKREPSCLSNEGRLVQSWGRVVLGPICHVFIIIIKIMSVVKWQVIRKQ
jgi:hypothetical protein